MGISTNSVNFNGQNQSVSLNRPQLPSFRPHSKIANQICQDVFIKIQKQNTADACREVERLFPNGELNKIYEKIVQDYGIENPPQLLVENSISQAAASYNQDHNSVKFNPNFLNELNNFKKMYVEFKDENGNEISGYTPDPNVQGKIGFMINDSTYNAEKEYFNKKGINTKLVPYDDDDKRKYVIFVLAHELRHAFQAQVINQAEGLGMYNLLKEKETKFTDNLIAKKLIELMFNQRYQSLEWSKYPTNIKYQKGTKKWDIANEFYKASLDYTNPNQSEKEYHNNLTELDANNIAEKYLVKTYGDFNQLIKGESLNAFLQKQR